MMALLMEVREADMLARACDLGVAMQFTNIARDVGEDAGEGRLYLPLDWLAEAGVDPEALLARPEPSPELASVTMRLLAEAERLYLRAEAGLAALPPECRPALFAARFIYADIGRQVARMGGDSITGRARTGGGRKAALALRALGRSAVSAALGPAPADLAAPPLPETAYLVKAAARAPGRAPRGAEVRGLLGLVELMAELEARDRAADRAGLGA
jgi:phytoene synthase